MMESPISDGGMNYGGEKEMDSWIRNEELQKVPGDKNLLCNEIIGFMDNFIQPIQREHPKSADSQQRQFRAATQHNQPRGIHVGYEDTLYDHPFGMEVINVQCMKCGEYGHMNIDRKCSLYGRDTTVEPCQPLSNRFPLYSINKQDEIELETTAVRSPVPEETGTTEHDRDEAMEVPNYSKTHWKKLLLRRQERETSWQISRLQGFKH